MEQSDDVGFVRLFEAFWRGRWIIVSITAAFVIAAGITATVLPKQYEATALISPAASGPDGGLGGLDSLASQFGGLASLAGISVRGDSRKSEAIAVLQSEVLTTDYIREQNLLPILFPDRWDSVSKRWIAADPRAVPTLWQANQLFKGRIRTVTENPKNGLVTLTITWSDPTLAARWANDLIKATNSYMRSKAIEQTERNIDYLKKQAAATDIAQVRTAIYTILESEIKNAMLARGTDEYALKVIDPAVPPESHSSPRRLVWMIVAFLGGLAVSALVVLLRSALRD